MSTNIREKRTRLIYEVKNYAGTVQSYSHNQDFDNACKGLVLAQFELT